MMRVVVFVAALLAGCATGPTPRPAPVFKLQAEDVGSKQTSCGAGELVRQRGASPAGSRVIAVLRVEADQAVSLEALEQVLEVAARRRCAAGFAVTRASADDGATGYLDATAEAWTLDTADVGAVGSP